MDLKKKSDSKLNRHKNRALKRIFDIFFSIFALSGIAILLPFITFKIKRQSKGPVFFSQLRTGKNGKNFLCYKFRSMHINDEADLKQASEDDPRTFPFGLFMRQHNIDELPQFWNVLKGDMSVVGPRPHMLVHTEKYAKLIPEYMERHSVKPGVTGWAQVTGYCGEMKNLADAEERVKRDLWYIEHWSFKMDWHIIWMTVSAIWKRKLNTY